MLTEGHGNRFSVDIAGTFKINLSCDSFRGTSGKYRS